MNMHSGTYGLKRAGGEISICCVSVWGKIFGGIPARKIDYAPGKDRSENQVATSQFANPSESQYSNNATTPAEIAKHNNLLISFIFCLRI